MQVAMTYFYETTRVGNSEPLVKDLQDHGQYSSKENQLRKYFRDATQDLCKLSHPK